MRKVSLDLVMVLAAVVGVGGMGACSTNNGSATGHGTGNAGATGAAGVTTGAAGTGGAGTSSGVGGSSGSAGSIGSAGSSGLGGSTASGGTTGAAGTTAAGGTSGSAGALGAAGSTADGGTSGKSGTVDKKAAELAAGPFTCTAYLGAYLTMEWWYQGFLSDGVDTTKWELKWHHHAGVPQWGDPSDVFWSNTGDPLNDAEGAPIQNPCKTNSLDPDRVVMLAISWELLNQADWAAGLEQDIATIKMKYPNVKWIDLMPMVRCPDNKMCNPDENYGPGADTIVADQDCYVPPYEDAAIAQVVAAHTDVGEGPVLMATACVVPPNGAHLSGADDKLEAQEIATYYKALP